MFGEMFDGTQIALDAETEKWRKFYEDLDALGKKFGIKQEIIDNAVAINKNKQHAKQFQQADEFFGNMASLQNSSSRELFEIGKAAAIAQATISGVQAVMNAQATQPYYLGVALAIGAAVNSAAQIAQIAQTQFKGYKDGGFTGNVGTSQVAGLVHGQEFVMNAAATAKNRPMLEAMNSGKGAVGSASVSVKIENYGTSKQFEVIKNDQNEIRIIARDEADKAIRERVPSLVAGEIANPNSRISKSMGQNTSTARRR